MGLGLLTPPPTRAQGLLYDDLPAGRARVAPAITTWPRTNLTYSFANGTPDIAIEAERDAIREALGLWSAYSPLRFTELSPGTTTDLTFAWFVRDHGDGYPFDGVNGVLAHAFYPTVGQCHFDEEEAWTLTTRADSNQPIDLVTVAAHEIGHLLGLEHSSAAGALMFAYYNGSHRYLASEDITAIQGSYPDPCAGSCDDGNVCTDDSCDPAVGCRHVLRAECLQPILMLLMEEDECGDGSVDAGEQCDDGNSATGDGCSPACRTEASTQEPIAGSKLLVRDAADATRRRLSLRAVDARIDGSAASPLASGAAVQLFNATTGESVCFPLPNVGNAWQAAGRSGWKYRDSKFTNGPCKAVTFRHGKLTVSCSARSKPIAYSLDEATQGALGVRVTIGALTYCAHFGGTITNDSGTDPPIAGGRGQFKAIAAPTPSVCATPPTPCP